MSHRIIIDGYNVIHLVDEYAKLMEIDLETARRRLINDLAAYQHTKQVDITIVFDGALDAPIADQVSHGRGLKIIFSRPPLKADPVIINLIRAERKKRKIIIITDDRQIKTFASSEGCQILSPMDFFKRTKTKNLVRGKYENQMTPEELEEWKKIFGVDE